MIYAGFWRRFLACILDGIFVMIISIILIIPFWVTPLCIIIGIIYRVVFETSSLRATPGKALMGMSVIKTNGAKLTIKDSLIRLVMSFISSTFLCAGYLMALFTQKKQTLHDFVADTVVIDETFAENNFWQIFLTRGKEIIGSENQVPPVPQYSLEDLYNLYQKGILTEDEYNMKKEEHLKRL